VSDKFPCVCKKLLAEKYGRDEKLPYETFFDELGNYKYCQPSVADYFKGVTGISETSGSRKNIINKIIDTQGSVYRDVTAITILRYELIPYIQGKLPGVNANNSVLAVLERMYAENNNTLIRVKIPEIPGSKTVRMNSALPETKKRRTNKSSSQVQLSQPCSSYQVPSSQVQPSQPCSSSQVPSSQVQLSQPCSSYQIPSSQVQLSQPCSSSDASIPEMDQSCSSLIDDPIDPTTIPDIHDRVILRSSRLLEKFTEEEIDKITEGVNITASVCLEYNGKYYYVSLTDVAYDPVSGDGFFKDDPESALDIVERLKRDKAEMITIVPIPGSLTKRLR
jgi:hypothetical protein